jgi:23S rRNA (cytidine1920-2'-O)/16S rRNA (cytidine1409-2'-O)-methyltransferase
VNGQVAPKPSTVVFEDAQIALEAGPPYVSRGGEKLGAALEAFELDVSGKICADLGASTGGFTDCLLQEGALKVYAIDVGKGILHWKLRQDPRVILMEDTNARGLERLPERPDVVTIDASFISLKLLLPVVRGWFLDSRGEVLALIKPQFEAGRTEAARGAGVIKDQKVHRQVLMDVLGYAEAAGFSVRGLVRSPLLGPKGNVEFFTYLCFPQAGKQELMKLIEHLFLTR